MKRRNIIPVILAVTFAAVAVSVVVDRFVIFAVSSAVLFPAAFWQLYTEVHEKR